MKTRVASLDAKLSYSDLLRNTICAPCEAEQEVGLIHDTKLFLPTAPWGTFMRMKRFLDPEREKEENPVIRSFERTVRTHSSANLMLRAIQNQLNCGETVVVPRRDGVPASSALVREAVPCDCCSLAVWNALPPGSNRDELYYS